MTKDSVVNAGIFQLFNYMYKCPFYLNGKIFIKNLATTEYLQYFQHVGLSGPTMKLVLFHYKNPALKNIPLLYPKLSLNTAEMAYEK